MATDTAAPTQCGHHCQRAVLPLSEQSEEARGISVESLPTLTDPQAGSGIGLFHKAGEVQVVRTSGSISMRVQMSLLSLDDEREGKVALKAGDPPPRCAETTCLQ